MTACENVFAKLKEKPIAKLILGGSVLSLLIFLFPSLYGEGYNSINILLNGKTEADWDNILNNSIFYGHGDLLLVYLGLVLLTKVFATSATNGGGGCGGTFAPSLFIGAFSGFFFARVWNINQIGVYIPEKNFTLLGMAGVMAGVMHAPLTGIFLIAEITGGYGLFMPLMIVSVCAYLVIIIFEPHSIYGMRLAREGKLITHHTDRAVLTLMSLDSVIDKNYTSVPQDMTLGQLTHAISRSNSNILPVVTEGGNLLGEVNVNNIRHLMFRTELYNHFHAAQLMTPPAATLGVNDPMEDVMQRFDQTHAIMLPVLDTDNHLVGYISRTRMYAQYRQMVADMSEE
jgi:CIC family chloride channel protein